MGADYDLPPASFLPDFKNISMALINTDWTRELSQVKTAVGEIVEQQVAPLIRDSIGKAGRELSDVVRQAGDQVEANIRLVSEEIHMQRRMTRDELVSLIDYAADKLAATIDDRVAMAKSELSSLVTEKFVQLRGELEDAAIKSRKTLYVNLSVSLAAALGMAAVGIVYKKISIGELDLFSVFRVLLLSLAVGTGFYAALRALSQWRALNRTKRNAASALVNYMGLLRPNGALGAFLICLAVLAVWFGTNYLQR